MSTTKEKTLSPLVYEVVLQRLRLFATDLGVEIVFVAEKEWGSVARARGIDVSPVHSDFLACDFAAWKVFVCRAAPPVAKTVGGILHEIAHVAADERQPERTDELDFLGWEYAAAKKLAIVRHWKIWMDTYGLSTGEDFGHLSPEEQHRTLREFYCDAIMRGLVTKTGRPLRVRPSPKGAVESEAFDVLAERAVR